MFFFKFSSTEGPNTCELLYYFAINHRDIQNCAVFWQRLTGVESYSLYQNQCAQWFRSVFKLTTKRARKFALYLVCRILKCQDLQMASLYEQINLDVTLGHVSFGEIFKCANHLQLFYHEGNKCGLFVLKKPQFYLFLFTR